MQKKVLATAIAGALVPMASQAVDFKVSGHINRAIRFVDDGHGSEVQHIDNSNSRSRVRFVGSEKFGSMTAGVNLEIAFASNRSTGLGTKSTLGNGADGSDSFDTGDDIRHSALWFSGSWGKLTMGHTSEAYDGVQDTNLSGLGIVNGTFPSYVSGVRFRTSTGGLATGTAGTAATGLNAFNSLDGGRIDIVRYDSPKLGGMFGLSASMGNNEFWSASANLNTALAGGKLSAQIGYQDADNRSGNSSYGGSASYIFSQGTSITGSYAVRDFVATGRNDAERWTVQLAHKWGNNVVGIHYNDTSDHVDNGSDGTNWGVGFIHTIPKPGVELYAAYNNYDLDITGANIDDLDAFVVGARVKFQ
jgi:hypothetical protein